MQNGPVTRVELISGKVRPHIYVLAHLLACLVASFCFNSNLLDKRLSNFESAANFSFPQKIDDFLSMFVFGLSLTFAECFFITVVPFFIFLQLAKRLSWEKSPWFYVLGAVAISPLLAYIDAVMPGLGFEVMGPEPSAAEKFFHTLPSFLFIAVVAGVTAYLTLRFSFRSRFERRNA